jgi:hypothetical protein
MCKPATHESQLYKSVTAFLRSLLPTGTALLCIPTAAGPVASAGTDLVVYSEANLLSSSFSNLIGKTQPGDPSLPAIRSAGGDQAIMGPQSGAPALEPELLVDYEYFTTQAPDDRRPLAQKLADGGRSHEVKEAQRKKERFAMSLQRHSAQVSSLARYTRLLSDVESRFNRHVRPSIKAGAPPQEINHQIQQAVIDPALKSQLAETPDATSSLIESALYYLTGNCHVRWDDNKD